MSKSAQANTDQQQTSRLQQWLEKIWYQKSKGYLVLLPLSAVYCAINTLQRWLKSPKQNNLSCPVIVVGNITVGGTGKTPLTLYVVECLQKAGYKPAIITRGYGGKATQWPLLVSPDMDPQLVGDEAVLMASRSGVPVYAGADRLASIRQLLKEQDCDVIVSDDGMQHYKLPRDIQIAVIDQARQLGNGWCLPAGPLREPKNCLTQCDFLVLNGANSIALNETESSYDYGVAVPKFGMQLKGNKLTNLKTKQQKPISEFVGKQLNAISGIGNPQRFFKTLQDAGLNIITTQSFPDHHPFRSSDFQKSDDIITLMTEKDAVKCQYFATDKMWYLPVTATLETSFESQLLALLADKLKTREQRHG
jgi:tetraacyldisaccharide 4'-kinase